MLHKALEVAPHGGEVVVRDALLGAELPHDGPQLGKVHVVDAREEVVLDVVVDATLGDHTNMTSATHGCQMAKFDPFLSLDCARVEGMEVQSKEKKGSNFAV